MIQNPAELPAEKNRSKVLLIIGILFFDILILTLIIGLFNDIEITHLMLFATIFSPNGEGCGLTYYSLALFPT
jgi:hypothetical protein